jgi:hypothetical protein
MLDLFTYHPKSLWVCQQAGFMSFPAGTGNKHKDYAERRLMGLE